MKQMTQKYFTKKDGEELENRLTKNLTRDLTQVIDAKLQGEMTKLKYELQDEQKKFLNEMHNLVDGLVTEAKDNQSFRATVSYQTNENTEKIIRLEKKVFGVGSTY
ncbi:hypothetical protein KBC75_03955 [Candidatus Shapirobacteria bacterium]|nr:hypothetical protein [Candidatus Shapirobacteria bacterium]